MACGLTLLDFCMSLHLRDISHRNGDDNPVMAFFLFFVLSHTAVAIP